MGGGCWGGTELTIGCVVKISAAKQKKILGTGRALASGGLTPTCQTDRFRRA
jgi:hypothetical protein